MQSVWFCLDLMPFNTVDKDVFNYFFSKNTPQFIKPNEATIRRVALLQVYDEVKLQLLEDLQNVRTLNIMFDCWTDKYRRQPYMGIRIAYVNDDWNYRIATVSCKVLASHTGEAIACHAKNELKSIIGKRKN